ncbi:hypothetical protein [Bradyrhizobium sp. CB1015]|uniref:hypothetical protein n=1 Tax=Bradyrhizobium sp. CB1015 TaxID=2976822 RepID=UPI0021A97D65|nr:hypothetical protein [Bradyrhizobium sp. CB1015]UWU95223.1 hypothetical protein N2604_15750 [Bradyrhizobium sp. CB1015]
MMKTSARAALIVLAGLVLLSGGIAQAAPNSTAGNKSESADKGADTAKHRRHDSRRTDSKKTVQKSDDKADKKDAAGKPDESRSEKTDGQVPPSSQMAPGVANANAQLAPDTPTAAAASAMTNRANDNVQAAADNTNAENPESQVVAPDQLNDIDRALQENRPPQKAVIAATEAQPRPAPVMASTQQSSAWDQSSLIGKIFIGVGTLLTLASAARMFMA